VDRRSFLKAATAGALGAAAVPLTAGAAAAGADPLAVARYRKQVPEIFRPLADPPAHSQALIIGSGFGAAATMLRLARAGVTTTVLERGSRWPNDPRRTIFSPANDADGRAFWHRTKGREGSLMAVKDNFGGVLDVTDFKGIEVWRAAAVGGGSVVYSGAHPVPERRFFDEVFHGLPTYQEMVKTYIPRVKALLGLSIMPADVYAHRSFSHSRTWDAQARKAGYQPQQIDGNWRWSVVRDEMAGRARASAILGETHFGNSDGAKADLNQNYIPMAEATGKARVYPGHDVTSIGQERDGRYTVTVRKIDPTGRVLRTTTLTCDQLYLAAGSVGTSQLLVKARETGTLRNLNEHVGAGWGTNGDSVLVRGPYASSFGAPQGAPAASRIVDERGMPLSLLNWFMFGLPTDAGMIVSLGMGLDKTRATFRYDAATRSVGLTWPGQPELNKAMKAAQTRIGAANSGKGPGPMMNDVRVDFTPHPLGGVVIGKATDAYGRVKGHPGLYVNDGSLMPGSTALVNPALIIAALAERNIAKIIASGG
jgi:cholesterol oxidase